MSFQLYTVLRSSLLFELFFLISASHNRCLNCLNTDSADVCDLLINYINFMLYIAYLVKDTNYETYHYAVVFHPPVTSSVVGQYIFIATVFSDAFPLSESL